MTKLCLFATIMSAGLFALSSAFIAILLPRYAIALAVAALVCAIVAAISFKRDA